MNRVLNIIIIWSLFTITNIYSNLQNREVFNEYKEVDELNENNKSNDEIEESEKYSTKPLTDAQRLDRLARGAYVDRDAPIMIIH
ncbi:uncharacterized protein isoform X2 [Rhodnius prolixus]|uniref:uncharacterized protein isoform X2 n=1 Tax=Rhodnius prolixus TaxID=13249 RepID=UPI003D189FED